MKRFSRFGIGIVLVVLLASFLWSYYSASSTSGQLLSFEEIIFSNCAPPCWRDLTPGTSDELKTTKALLLDQSFEGDRVGYFEYTGFEKYVLFNDFANIEFFVNQSTLVQIQFVPKTNEFTIIDIIGFWGEPEAVTTEISGQEVRCYQTSLYYPSNGVVAHFGSCLDGDIEIGELSENTPLSGIDYLSVSDNPEDMIAFLYDNETRTKRTPGRLQQWSGLGVYAP